VLRILTRRTPFLELYTLYLLYINLKKLIQFEASQCIYIDAAKVTRLINGRILLSQSSRLSRPAQLCRLLAVTFPTSQFHDLYSACVSMFLYPTFSLLACSSTDSFFLACASAFVTAADFFCLAAKRFSSAACCFARIFHIVSS
jgi:hypothetical protein